MNFSRRELREQGKNLGQPIKILKREMTARVMITIIIVIVGIVRIIMIMIVIVKRIKRRRVIIILTVIIVIKLQFVNFFFSRFSYAQ